MAAPAAGLLLAGLLLAGLLLAGCQGQIQGIDRHVPPSGTILTYACPDGSEFQVQFSGLEEATILNGDRSVTLHGVVSERGAKYKAGVIILHVEGNEATLETLKGTQRCQQRA